jgi:hypothetical protein
MAQVDLDDFPLGDLKVNLAEAAVQVVFAYKETPTEWKMRLLGLHDDLPEAFRQKAEEQVARLDELYVGRGYDPEWDLREREYFLLDNEPPVGGDFFPQLTEFASLPAYEDRRRQRRPNAWLVVAQLPDETLAYVGARITPARVLERTGRKLRLVYREGAFDSLDETVVTLSPSFDWLAWKGALLVLDAKNFHQTFRDIPALIAKVDEHLAAVTEHVPVANLDDLATRIKSYPAMMVKLQRIVERADMHTRPAQVLREYGEEYSIPVDWDGDTMIFDGAVERQWNILRLLDEARTLGPVTGKHWDTSSKTEV